MKTNVKKVKKEPSRRSVQVTLVENRKPEKKESMFKWEDEKHTIHLAEDEDE